MATDTQPPENEMAMKLKIEESNKAAIEAAMHAVNGRSYQHSYTSINELLHVASVAEKALDALKLNQASRSGAVFYSTSGGSVPNSYKGIRNATTVKLLRGSSDWFVVSISKTTLSNSGGKDSLHLTAKQDAEVIAKVRTAYQMLPAQEAAA